MYLYNLFIQTFPEHRSETWKTYRETLLYINSRKGFSNGMIYNRHFYSRNKFYGRGERYYMYIYVAGHDEFIFILVKMYNIRYRPVIKL